MILYQVMSSKKILKKLKKIIAWNLAHYPKVVSIFLWKEKSNFMLIKLYFLNYLLFISLINLNVHN